MATVASRKQRGAQTERMVARAWEGDGWPHAEVVRGPGRDLTGTPGVAVEIKARREWRPLEWMRQAQANAGDDIPIVVARPDGAGETTVDDWPAIVPHGVLRRLLREAGYGSEAA